ncbi:MAG: leucine-rich repeat domain-containing protein, partial [Clostridia bacterium]|nr:leucine-rich repeat domain-containing protein [Clostridia bacterium]
MYLNNTKVTDLVIPTGIEQIKNRAFDSCASITSVTIPSSVKSIGLLSFAVCRNIESVVFEDNSQLATIGERAFVNCDSLDSIIIPDGVTSIGNQAFSGCDNLETVTFGENSQLATISSYAFNNCNTLICIKIPSGVTSIDNNAFYGCTSLESVTFGENSQLATISSYAFYDCDSLTSIEIPSSVTSITEAFSGCDNLETVTFGKNSQLTSIGYHAFYDCSSLTSIVIPSSVTSIAASVFSGCDNLTIYCEATSQPSGWYYDWNYSNRPVYWYSETQPITTGNYWHYVDGVVTEWQKVDFECTINNNQLTITGYTGTYTEVVIPDKIAGYDVVAIGDNAFEYNDDLESVSIPASVTSIGYHAFYDCDNLESITIPNNVKTIGQQAFDGCNSLTNVVIPASVTSLGWRAFACGNGFTIYCEATSKQNNWDSFWNVGGETYWYSSTQPTTEGNWWHYVDGVVTVWGELEIESNENFEYIVIENQIALSKYIGSSQNVVIPLTIDSKTVVSVGDIFANYYGTATIYCEATEQPSTWSENWNSKNYPVYWYSESEPATSQDGTAYVTNCWRYVDGVATIWQKPLDFEYIINNNQVTITGYTGTSVNVTIPATIKDTPVTAIGYRAFYDCDNLASVTFGANSQLQTIGSHAFYYCDNLTSISIPDSVTSIGEKAFYWCDYLANVTFGENSQLESIGDYAFYDCDNLSSIVIPDSVTSIGDYAFSACYALTIYCEATSKPSGWHY